MHQKLATLSWTALGIFTLLADSKGGGRLPSHTIYKHTSDQNIEFFIPKPEDFSASEKLSELFFYFPEYKIQTINSYATDTIDSQIKPESTTAFIRVRFASKNGQSKNKIYYETFLLKCSTKSIESNLSEMGIAVEPLNASPYSSLRQLNTNQDCEKTYKYGSEDELRLDINRQDKPSVELIIVMQTSSGKQIGTFQTLSFEASRIANDHLATHLTKNATPVEATNVDIFKATSTTRPSLALDPRTALGQDKTITSAKPLVILTPLTGPADLVMHDNIEVLNQVNLAPLPNSKSIITASGRFILSATHEHHEKTIIKISKNFEVRNEFLTLTPDQKILSDFISIQKDDSL